MYFHFKLNVSGKNKHKSVFPLNYGCEHTVSLPPHHQTFNSLLVLYHFCKYEEEWIKTFWNDPFRKSNIHLPNVINWLDPGVGKKINLQNYLLIFTYNTKHTTSVKNPSLQTNQAYVKLVKKNNLILPVSRKTRLMEAWCKISSNFNIIRELF